MHLQTSGLYAYPELRMQMQTLHVDIQNTMSHSYPNHLLLRRYVHTKHTQTHLDTHMHNNSCLNIHFPRGILKMQSR